MPMEQPSSQWVIRDAQANDLPRIVAIYNASIPSRLATADLEPVTVESRQGWFQNHDPATYPIWIATHGETIAGWVSLSPFYGRPAYHATREVSLYIDPSFHRQGLGTHLFSAMIDHSPSIGTKTLLSFVFAHNQASIRLNQKFGFTQWAHFPRIAELDHIERDVLIFGKRVGE